MSIRFKIFIVMVVVFVLLSGCGKTESSATAILPKETAGEPIVTLPPPIWQQNTNCFRV